MHEQKFKDLLSSKCQVSVERIVLDLESEGPGLFPLGVTFFSKFYNPNLHNIAGSDRIGFKTKTPNRSGLIWVKKINWQSTDWFWVVLPVVLKFVLPNSFSRKNSTICILVGYDYLATIDIDVSGNFTRLKTKVVWFCLFVYMSALPVSFKDCRFKIVASYPERPNTRTLTREQ